MRQAEQSNIILGSEVGRLDDDKVRLERSIREREILSHRVKQELNNIRGDFHRFLHASKTFGPGTDKALDGVQAARDEGGGSDYFIGTAALVTPTVKTGLETRLTTEDLNDVVVQSESSSEGVSETRIAVSKRGSIHIHRSGN
jgi:hypothetical protein